MQSTLVIEYFVSSTQAAEALHTVQSQDVRLSPDRLSAHPVLKRAQNSNSTSERKILILLGFRVQILLEFEALSNIKLRLPDITVGLYGSYSTTGSLTCISNTPECY